MHPLACLYPLQPPKVKARIVALLARFLDLDPLIVSQYKWTLRMLSVLNRLCGRWGVLGPSDLRHRESPGKTLVRYK